MASQFEQWEKDPFFPAAEEVQESADGMESTYRTLIHALKEPSVWKTEDLRRDLRTALGTAKWQLDEFERAVNDSYSNSSCNETKTRHSEFVSAMKNQVSKVEKCLNELTGVTKKPPRPWVRLDEGESKELALFLSGKPAENVVDQSTPECSNKFSKHRRTASAGADIGAWNIEVADDVSVGGVDGKTEQTPRKTPSFSGFLNTMEFASKLQWSKNEYRKLKVIDQKLPETQPVSRGCYERSKSCLESDDDCYQKQLYGWYGAIQRQLQRSQYYVQYSRPTQMIFWVLVMIFLFALVTVIVI
ncbi:hypothetical protein L1987_66435 [Smallanthus sonchifolius]|uniref:Uncharacterized protein n=1 Tax=Smallanthus sonchifolius TaxID=185202 RepID=A0ACB9BX44_9ASTR|nr:hypothetical protein L1987_66435 [Smallanthus sonchifolius]